MGKSLVPAAQASATPESSPKAPRFPPVGMYGVMQINLSAMVQHLHDEDVLARASCVEMKKYLVYIRQFGELPFHSSPWCRYSVSFIGTTLRSEDPAIGITSDMVVPIFPCSL
ncbi:hypothetical protein BD309DRAFT_995430 [Dichomitus squalens]|uniref:Uncharacterized protein n=1 Tax=Dichomitus squalens TaxID=114155 RepID=A0A4Q9N7S4_9APHY|nr:hypothetical protein BD309DRAFT_995430 [Dichomitus squalens]TBU55905.1 hypothetical protein BD310DRAFT_652266 [Dichomitus squalens]